LRERSLVYLEDDETREMDNPLMLWYLTFNMEFYKNTKAHGEMPARPPKDLLQNMIVKPDISLPHLRGITTIPTFAPDGKLHSRAGYCPSMELVFRPLTGIEGLEVPENPTDNELTSAVEYVLTELLGDFPFVNEASKAHVFAALLLPYIRPMVDGPTPLHLISKPKAGTGATLLAELIGGISCGKVSLQPVPSDEAETRRSLLAVLREDPAVIILDNVKSLGGAALPSCLTSETYQDRVIGSSRLLRVRNRCLWLATGNNPALSDEMARRTVTIRLDTGLESPDLRDDFRHPDLKAWVIENRLSLIWCMVTIVRAWIARGRPPGPRTLGSFESWARIIGGILGVARVDGFLTGVEEARVKSDAQTAAFRVFVEAWAAAHRSQEVTSGALLDCAESLDLGSGGGKSRSIRLGILLGQRTDQCFGEWRVEKRSGKTNGYQCWRLSRIETSGSSGCSG
jgi:hypothetical protein